MYFNQTASQAVSRVRHPDKYQCVLQCIEKEEQGFECVQPIRRVSYQRKNFNISGKYIDYVDTDTHGYYEAVYTKRMCRDEPRTHQRTHDISTYG